MLTNSPILNSLSDICYLEAGIQVRKEMLKKNR